MTDLKIEYLPVTALKPYERNAKNGERCEMNGRSLTYKIGEKYAMLFVKKGMDDIVFVLEHAMEVLAENLRVCIDRLCNSITEIFENNIDKPKLPRPPKNICPNKTAPFRRIIPHARTVC